ncbi:MAG: hypothetical protein JNM57_10405 [Cyclobacteriaceae bacterium]|nr:hypothetical protein [Cyclobacteriaceae bacterium]
MELRDLFVTPVVIMLLYFVAYLVRNRVTDEVNRVYFLPALSLKIFGALAVGFIYQFYYAGGDTFNYHTHGSRHIWNAFVDSPTLGLKLLLTDGTTVAPKGTYLYASRILFFSDPSSYVVIRLAALFDLVTFSSYSATAVLFAAVSFGGMWLFFQTFYEDFPHLHRWIAIAAFFIPSVFFWGSGLLKDTITLGCLAIATYCVKRIFFNRQISISNILLLLLSLYIMFAIKKYILLCFLPATMLWIFIRNLSMVKSFLLKVMLVPFVVGLMVVSGYYLIKKIAEDDARYSLEKIAITAKVTAYDIGFYTGKDAGSGYSLGELDGTFSGMLKLAPQAINVSLFRPYLWEVRNPLMLLSALESLGLLFLTGYAFYRARHFLLRALGNPTILFCLMFSITFAFAVGVSTFNFGTLTRYKIPLLPFYFMALVLMIDYSNKERYRGVVDSTE